MQYNKQQQQKSEEDIHDLHFS